jgi:plasmid stability protein
MKSITLRNIPDQLLDRLRTLSIIEKRSLNNEILIVLEKGLTRESENKTNFKDHLTMDTQIKIWQNLCGQWKDNRSTDEIIRDIIGSRSEGRSVDL